MSAFVREAVLVRDSFFFAGTSGAGTPLAGLTGIGTLGRAYFPKEWCGFVPVGWWGGLLNVRWACRYGLVQVGCNEF